MECEKCSKEYDGTYGSGRFCSSFCARSFSTQEKREEINKKVSRKMKGRPIWPPRPKKVVIKKRRIKKKFPILTKEQHLLGGRNAAKTRLRKQQSVTWDETTLAEKRRRLMKEQDNKCLCGIREWNGELLTLEFHHADGNKKNNKRENVSFLCPNCHSQTPNFRYRNKSRYKCKE